MRGQGVSISTVMLVGIVVVGIYGVLAYFYGPDMRSECLRTVGERPCIQGTIEYDGEGECECLTRYGELEWDLPHGAGCDMD